MMRCTARGVPATLQVLAAVAALAGAPVVAAGAQAPRPAPASPDTARRDSATVLSPVTVEVSRIAGSRATAPYAVSHRSRASIPDGTPATALDEALRTIPGVQVDNRYNYALGERISIRGAGARAQFGVRGVRVLVDGIPATLPDGQTALNLVDLSTIHAVEVLRGPVSSLFGNAAGGAILLETTPAPAAPLAVRAIATSGSNGLLRTRGEAGGTRGRFDYLASASRVAYDGYRSHSDADNRYASARMGWTGANDIVTASFNAVRYEARNPGSLSDSLLRVDRKRAFQNNVAQGTGETGSQRQGGAHWRRALAAAEVLEVSGWLIGRDIDNPIPGRVVVLDRRAGGVRALLRGDRDVLSWTAGLEHERQHDDRQNYANVSGARGALVLDQAERVSALGAFAQASASLHTRVTALAGIRHDRTAFEARDRFVASGDPDDSGRRTLSAVSPSAGLSLSLDGGVTLYSNVGTAFETPTTTELANRPDGAGGFNPSLQPQRTVSYEFGARHTREQASAQFAVYRALVRDALIPFEVPDVPGRQFFRNAGLTATSGVEAAATAVVGRAVQLAASYTFTNPRFRSYTVGSAVLDGNLVPGVARHRAELSGSWSVARHTLAADLRHQSRTVVDDANTAWSPGYTLADVRVAPRPFDGRVARVRLSFGVQNLFGAEYNSSVVVNAFGRRYFEPGPGRAFHVGLTAEHPGR